MKQCRKCGEPKALSEYYQHPMMADGHVNFCKECVKQRTRKHQKTLHSREVQRAWSKTPNGKAKAMRSQQRRRAKYPERQIANNRVAKAIRSGILTKQLCEVCKDAKAEAHHDDYLKPLEVRWLCFKHHRRRHGQLLGSK